MNVRGLMIRALWKLAGYGCEPVPAAELASYMKVETEAARKALLGLQRDRLARKRTRKGEEVWEPWK